MFIDFGSMQVKNLLSTGSIETIKVGKHDISIGGKISEGGYANVYKARSAQTGEIMALK